MGWHLSHSVTEACGTQRPRRLRRTLPVPPSPQPPRRVPRPRAPTTPPRTDKISPMRLLLAADGSGLSPSPCAAPAPFPAVYLSPRPRETCHPCSRCAAGRMATPPSPPSARAEFIMLPFPSRPAMLIARTPRGQPGLRRRRCRCRPNVNGTRLAPADRRARRGPFCVPPSLRPTGIAAAPGR